MISHATNTEITILKQSGVANVVATLLRTYPNYKSTGNVVTFGKGVGNGWKLHVAHVLTVC